MSVAVSTSARPRPLASPLVLALASIVAIGAALRFSTLGVQSYHHDEIITVTRVLPGSFTHMLGRVRESESNPPLYYVLAWLWAKLFGTGEIGLRSLSALVGSATVPVAFLAGREALGERTGLVVAALAAVNPMLIWYSQEARSYAMLVFFGALALFFFLRALRSGGERGLLGWGLASAAALCSHYFAGFAIAIEAVWLLTALPASRRRAAAIAIGGVALVGVALLPLLSSQINAAHIGWISHMPLSKRLFETGASFLAGETGAVIGEPPRHAYALVPALIVAVAAALFALRAGPEERRRALPALIVGLGVVALASLAALVGKDYVIERNLLPALLPLLVVVAIACSLRRAGKVGLALVAALFLYWLGFAIYVPLTPNLQRSDFRGVIEAAGPARGPRELVGWKLGATAFRYYLPDRSERVFGRLPVREIDVASRAATGRLAAAMPAGFRQIGRTRAGTITVTRFRSARVRVVPFYELRSLPTGYGDNGVVADGLPSLQGRRQR